MTPKIKEHTCPGCSGTGLASVMQPVQPGRKIYPRNAGPARAGARSRPPTEATPIRYPLGNLCRSAQAMRSEPCIDLRGNIHLARLAQKLVATMPWDHRASGPVAATFVQANLALTNPINSILLAELESLDREMTAVVEERQHSTPTSRTTSGVAAPDFQVIATKHANLRDWFQDALVEAPEIRPPALVPDDLPNEPLDAR